MTKLGELGELGEVVESILATATAVISPLDPFMGAATGFVLWAWQKDNAKNYENTVEDKFRRVDRNKLDKNYLVSNEFKALVVQTVDVASQTASDFKREVLANALVNSVVLPTSKFPGKQALLRVVSQMSDEEIIALTVLYDCERTGDKGTGNDIGNDEKAITSEHLVSKLIFKGREMGLEWSEEDSLVAYDGLAQLGLAKPPNLMWNGEMVKTTALGNRLIQWCSDEYEKEQGSGAVSV